MTASHRLATAAGLVAFVAAAPPDAAPRAARAGEPTEEATYSTSLQQVDAGLVAAGPGRSALVAGVAWYWYIPRVLPPSPDDDRRMYFVTNFGADGAALWSVALQALFWPDVEDLRALRLAPDGSVWIAGRGGLAGIPRAVPEAPGPRNDDDAWVARFDADGTLAFALHLGGTGDDRPTGLVVAPDGDAIVSGLTSSGDLALGDAFQPAHGGGASDGFVARVRGDGSGVAWASYLGDAASDGVSDVAIDPTGEILAVVHGFEPAPFHEVPVYLASDPVSLLRISADGRTAAAEPLPHGDADGSQATPFRLAVGPDGSVFAAATNSFAFGTSDSGLRAFVLRLSPDGGTTVHWTASGVRSGRICASQEGDLVLGPYAGVDAPDGGAAPAVRTLRGAPPEVRTVLAAADGTWSVLDVDIAPDGTLCVVGSGLAVPFHTPSDEMEIGGSFLARLPADSPAATSRLRVGRVGRNDVALRWTADGGPVERWIVERLRRGGRDSAHWSAVASLPGRARRARVAGLRSGSEQRIRIVAEFPSGVRVAVGSVDVFTRPAPPYRVVADSRRPGVVVRWAHRNGREVHFEVQRRVGGGPWDRVEPGNWGFDGPARGELGDPHPRVPGIPVAYRVRTVLPTSGGGRMVSAWTESDPFVPSPTRFRPQGLVEASDDVWYFVPDSRRAPVEPK